MAWMIAGLMFTVVAGGAAEPDLPSYVVYRAETPVVVDGVIDESAWRIASPVRAFQTPWKTDGTIHHTESRLLWDDTNLYVSFRCDDDAIFATMTQRDDMVCEEDCVEVFIAPDPDHLDLYFNFEMNTLGTLFDRGAFNNRSKDWNADGVQVAVTRKERKDSQEPWILEMAIPFDNFQNVARQLPPQPGDEWRLNLYRIDGQGRRQYYAWSDTRTPQPSYHVPDRFGVARFAVAPEPPTSDQAYDALKKAAGYMMNTVALHGGFVDKYTEDLSERWGEVPARNSMIWVQDPGTVTVGQMMLRTWQITGDPVFRDYAERIAAALVHGQLPCGGWHYFIDFDPEGVQQWYHDVLSKAWGWEEFYHWSGNATFDDATTTDATGFLLDLYLATQNPALKPSLDKALNMILESQYPIGGWPQRYPLSHEHVVEGRPDYTSYHTFNDGVIHNNIMLLWKAWEKFGDPRYREAALRGMFFTVISRMPEPQAGWGDQYDMNLQPAQARNFEPKALCPGGSAGIIGNLMLYYKMTGDRRFLSPVPASLEWLDRAVLPQGHSNQGHTHAQFVEVGTDRPLYAHREGTDIDHGRYWVDYVPVDFPGHYGMQIKLDVASLRKEFDRVSSLTPEQARAEYLTERHINLNPGSADPMTVHALIQDMNEKGAWVEDITVPDYTDWKFKPKRTFRGLSVRTFIRNASSLRDYWAVVKQP